MSLIPLNIVQAVGQTKLQQLIHAIAEAIANGALKAGDAVPSVNQMSDESGFSRDTVFKAYKILKERNLIESAPMKGYFVSGEAFKVFMLLDDFSAFKEQLYQSFRQNLPDKYSVDLLFHHYNREVFNQLIENSLGRYNMYVVMNIEEHGMAKVLNKIDPNKLLLLDIGTPETNKTHYILQDFNTSLISCLEEAIEKIKKYDEFVLVYDRKLTPHPEVIVQAVQHFCNRHSLSFRLIGNIESEIIEKGSAYFVIRDSDLVKVIKTCRAKHFRVGEDLGVLSYNDTPMKEIVGDGISVISTDFGEMGREAALFIKNKKKTIRILSTSLILRASL